MPARPQRAPFRPNDLTRTPHITHCRNGRFNLRSFRIGPDTGTGWSAVLINVDNAVSVSGYVGATANGGAWNDGSLQLNPGMGCHGDQPDPTTCMSPARSRSQFSLWCVLALNLVLTGNVTAVFTETPFMGETYANAEAIGVNQDPAWNRSDPRGFAQRLDEPPPGRERIASSLYAQAHFSECGGEPQQQKWTFGTPAPGYLDNNVSSVSMCMAIAGCGTEVIYDECETDPRTRTCAGPGNYTHFQWYLDGGELRTRLRADTCAEVVTPGNVIKMASCDGGSSQQFGYNTTTRQLTAEIGGQSLCLTSSSSGPGPEPIGATAVYGRPLTGGAWAMVLLNNSPQNTTLSCDLACLARMGLANRLVVVRDLWLHQNVSTITPGANFTRLVAANGASAFVKLMPAA